MSIAQPSPLIHNPCFYDFICLFLNNNNKSLLHTILIVGHCDKKIFMYKLCAAVYLLPLLKIS